MWSQPRSSWSPQAGRGRKDPPCSLHRELGPAHTSALDFWSPGQGRTDPHGFKCPCLWLFITLEPCGLCVPAFGTPGALHEAHVGPWVDRGWPGRLVRMPHPGRRPQTGPWCLPDSVFPSVEWVEKHLPRKAWYPMSRDVGSSEESLARGKSCVFTALSNILKKTHW